MMQYLTFLLLGFIGGTASGLLGIGGGIVIIPLLVYITNISPKAATAISMIQVFFASSFGTLFNYLQKNIKIKYAVYFGISSMAFSFLGSFLTKYIPDLTIRIIYFLSAITALALFLSRRKEDNKVSKEIVFDKNKFLKVVPLGVFAGLIGGILGVGGGFLYVPMLIYFFNFPIPIAVGTSLMIVLFNSVPGVIGKVISVEFDIVTAVIVAVGAIGGSRLGTYLNKRVKPLIIKIIFIIIIMLIIVRVAIDLYSYLTVK
jgi:uncharacterized membrane protein YfcA